MWYRTGTVTVTNASPTVTGSGTAWFSVVTGDWAFRGPDGRVYEILSVASDTSLTLAENYLGTTAAGQAYAAYPTQAVTRSLAQRLSDLIATYSGYITTSLVGLFGAGTDAAPGVAAATDTNTGLRWPATDSLSIVTGGAERVRVNASGNVGIGIATPATPLDINHATDSRVRLMLAGAGVMQMQSVPGANRLASNTADPLELWTNGVRRVSVDSVGNVGFGTSTPLAPMHVRTASTVPALFTRNSDVTVNGASGVEVEMGALSGTTPTSGGSFGVVLNNPATSGVMYFKTLGAGVLAERMRIDASGNVGVGRVPAGGRMTIAAVANYGDIATGYSLVLANTPGTGSNSNPITVGAVQFGDPTAANNDQGRILVVQENPAASTASSMRFFVNGGGGNEATLERMRINASGNLGIGLNPAARLDVGVSGGGRIRFDVSNPAETIATSSNFAGGSFSTLILDAAAHLLRVGGAQRMRIDSAGNWILHNPPSAPPTLATNGDLTLNPTSNTNVRISYRGGDGVTRVGNITLS